MKEYNFGYDSNGYEIDESTVEELARIADDMISEYANDTDAFVFACIDSDSFKEGYYMTGTAWGASLQYKMRAEISTEKFDMSDFINPAYKGLMFDYSMTSERAYATIEFFMDVNTEEITVSDIEVDCFYVTSEGQHQYIERDVEHFFEKYNKDKLCNAITHCLKKVVRDVHYTVSNI